MGLSSSNHSYSGLNELRAMTFLLGRPSLDNRMFYFQLLSVCNAFQGIAGYRGDETMLFVYVI